MAPQSSDAPAWEHDASVPTRPSWRHVEIRLRQEIEKGRFAVGEQIPTEVELVQVFQASRYAVRRALTNLQKEGIIRIEQGRGTFVHENFLVSYRLGERPRFTNVLLENQITPGQEILRIARIGAPAHVARSFDIPEGEPVVYMESLGYANGQVVKHDTNYFPLPRFEAIEPTLRTASSVTAALTAHGVDDYLRKTTSIVGRLPSPAEARLLRQLPANPIFEITRLDIDKADRPVLFGVTVFSCERVRLTLER